MGSRRETAHFQALGRDGGSVVREWIGQKRPEHPSDRAKIVEVKRGAGRAASDGDGNARWREGTKELLVRAIVADGDNDCIRSNLFANVLCDKRFAHAPKPDFKDLLTLQDLEWLITQEIAEQHAQFVRLPLTKFTRDTPVMPRERRTLHFQICARRGCGELIENRSDPLHPIRDYGRRRDPAGASG